MSLVRFFILFHSVFYQIFSKMISIPFKVVWDIEWSGNFSEGALCVNSHPLAHSWDTGPKHKHRALTCHNSLRLFHSDYPVLAFRNLTLANRILDGNIKWSTPFGMWKCGSPGFDTAISLFFFFLKRKFPSRMRFAKFYSEKLPDHLIFQTTLQLFAILFESELQHMVERGVLQGISHTAGIIVLLQLLSWRHMNLVRLMTLFWIFLYFLTSYSPIFAITAGKHINLDIAKGVNNFRA